MSTLFDWFNPLAGTLDARANRRDAPRFSPPLVVRYWSGGESTAHTVCNISRSGLFIESPDRWGTGTVVTLHLREFDDSGRRQELSSTSMVAGVVRCENKGMGLTFLFTDKKEEKQFHQFLAAIAARAEEDEVENSSGRRSRNQSGQSLVEFALLLPVLFLVLVNAVNFGGFFFAWITMANAARGASQYASMAGATVSSPKPATSTQIYNVVSQDISSLLNRQSLAVRVCTNTNGTIACNQTGTGTFTNPATDVRAEANLYVMEWVDVLYTYQPLIPLFSIGRAHATLPPTPIHRQTVMRRLQ
ncbi:MAG: PilZ domain-containing protein [Acidobacteriota bacterium]